ncbi:MAG: gamma-glutamyl-gamma-aminobutyrate hydrolase family protein [Gaiellales bacterium]
MRPIVGITAIPRDRIQPAIPQMPHATLNEGFCQLVEEAGGTPVILTATADVEGLASRIDGVVLSGGGDVVPERYGATAHPATGWLDPRRDDFELALVRALRRRGRPILGVCRGMQLVNVALGGTLVQHLPDLTDVDHEAVERWDATAHRIEIETGSRLRRLMSTERMEVNSVHHQAIGDLGEGLRAVAWAPDGVVEALESEEEPILAVQWHPEWSGSVDWDRQRRLFEDVVATIVER